MKTQQMKSEIEVINHFRNSVNYRFNVEEKEVFGIIGKAAFIHGAMSGDGQKKEKLIPKIKNQLCIKNGYIDDKISACLIGVVVLETWRKYDLGIFSPFFFCFSLKTRHCQ